ncbi:unnamed protein product, partial [Amoebophrya sp. A120]
NYQPELLQPAVDDHQATTDATFHDTAGTVAAGGASSTPELCRVDPADPTACASCAVDQGDRFLKEEQRITMEMDQAPVPVPAGDDTTTAQMLTGRPPASSGEGEQDPDDMEHDHLQDVREITEERLARVQAEVRALQEPSMG